MTYELPKADMSRCPPMPAIRPPLGLRPKYIVVTLRMREIVEAMQRYCAEGKRIPDAWLEELGSLNGGLKD